MSFPPCPKPPKETVTTGALGSISFTMCESVLPEPTCETIWFVVLSFAPWVVTTVEDVPPFSFSEILLTLPLVIKNNILIKLGSSTSVATVLKLYN